MDVLQLPGNRPGLAGAHVRQGRLHRGGDGIGLGRRGQEDGRLGQGELGLRQAQLQGAVAAGLHNGGRLGIGQPHILAGGAQQPPDGGNQIPRLQEPGQIVEGRVGVGAAQGFHQRGGDVIVVVPLPVIAHGAALSGALGVREGDGYRVPRPLPGGEEELHGVDGLAHVPAAGGGDVVDYPGLHRRGNPLPVFQEGNGPLYSRADFLGGDRLEFKNGAPAQNGVEYIEVRVLRGGGDEGNLAVFNELQQGLLLFLVEILDFVQVQQDAPRGQEGVQLVDDGLDVGDARRGGVEPAQGAVGPLRDNPGHSGFPRTGGAIENHVGNVAAFNNAAEEATLPQNMALSHHFVQAGGADFIGQGPVHTGRTSFPLPGHTVSYIL